MNIIITESQEEFILNHMLNEDYDYCSKRLEIKNFLDDNFIRASEDTIKDGLPSDYQFVLMVNKNKKPLKALSDKQLFRLLQNKYKDILPEEERDEFLKDAMTKWYDRKISKNGTSLV